MSTPFGNAIKAARLRMGLKQWELAKSLGVTRAAVGQWEAGVNEPSTHNLLKAISILKLNLDLATHGALIVEQQSYYGMSPNSGIDRPVGVFDFPVLFHVSDEDARVYNIYNDAPYFYVRRFEFFKDYPGLYAMFFSTVALSPKYEINDVVYVDPNKRPLAGEYAVLHFKKEAKPDFRSYKIVRRVLFIDSERVILSRLRADIQEEWPLSSFVTTDTVVREYELIRHRGNQNLPT